MEGLAKKNSFICKLAETLELFLFTACFAQISAAETHLNYAILGDAGYWNENSLQIRSSIRKTGLRSLILPGNNLFVPTDSYENVWNHWLRYDFSFDVVALGNRNKSYESEVAFFNIPDEFYTIAPAKNLRFLVLNSDNGANIKTQMEFAESVLSTAEENFIFVIFSHPSYTISELYNWKEKADFQLAIRPILQKYRSKITSLILGQDHIASIIQFGDLPVILSSAIQECQAALINNSIQDGTLVQSLWRYNGTPHWAQLQISSESKKAHIYFHNIKAKTIACSAQIETGKPIELGPECTL